MYGRYFPILMTLMIVSTGCEPGTPPKAAVSDVAVFTGLHPLAAEAGTAMEASDDPSKVTFNGGPFTAAQLKRHFETPSNEYVSKKSRSDDLLDGVQGESAFFQAAQRDFAASLAVNLLGNGNSAAPVALNLPAATAANSGTQQQLDDAKSAFASLLASTPNDSPSDHLDRVADFYASYVVKNLRVRGDSRVIDSNILATELISLLPPKDQEITREKLAALQQKEGAKALEGDRLILVVFQTQIDAGNEPDAWVGVRLTLSKAVDQRKAPIDLNQIRVIRIHPTHTYDVELQTFGSGQSFSLATALSGSGTFKGVGVSGSASQSALAEEQERRRYLSRTSKITSFADAAKHEFGFNFYPSNVKVEKSGNPFDALTGQSYNVKGYLEGGARDCAAIMIVPRALKSFECQVGYISGNINGGKADESQNRTDLIEHHTVSVTLPNWEPVELLAATAGAGPTAHPVAGPSGAPVTPVKQDPNPQAGAH